MQITFRYTDKEYHQIRTLNRLVGWPKWKSYSMAFLCLLPSFLLICLTGSMIAILGALVLLSSVIGVAILAAIQEQKAVDKHDHILTIDAFSKLEKHAHSETEARWDFYEQFDETKSEFRFRRLDRYTTIPKRAVPESEIAELRAYGEAVNSTYQSKIQHEALQQSENHLEETEADASQEDGEPISLYRRLFLDNASEVIYQFRYRPNDLAAAMSDPLMIVNTSKDTPQATDARTPQQKVRQRFFGWFWLLVFIAVAIYTLLAAPVAQFSATRWNLFQGVLLLGALVLPFVLLKLLNRWLRSRNRKCQPRVPTETNQLRLIKSGWAIGNPTSCQFFDWRDVQSFYRNGFCFGIRTFNDLIQVIPKRIFDDEQSADAFLEYAIDLRREHLRTFETKTSGIETGNPYQPPISQ